MARNVGTRGNSKRERRGVKLEAIGSERQGGRIIEKVESKIAKIGRFNGKTAKT